MDRDTLKTKSVRQTEAKRSIPLKEGELETVAAGGVFTKTRKFNQRLESWL